MGGRTGGMGFGVADGLRQKFTSYERDTESTLDFAGARHYSANQGRFTSVDPLMASASTANPQTFKRYTYVSNSPLTQIDPTGMFGICLGGGQIGQGGVPLGTFSISGQVSEQQGQQPAPLPVGPPPPGGPVTPGVNKIDVGPAPLPPGQEPWPTTLEVVEGENKTYNGEPTRSPSDEIIDSDPNYGVGKTMDYIIRDQVQNPMSQGVLLKETVVASNAQAKALMGRTEVNKKAVRPDHRGIVPDTLGAISTDPGVRRFLNQNQLNAHFTQTITIIALR